MTHVLIAGMTESGKTTLGKTLAKAYRERGVPVMVLDPMNDPGWPEGSIIRDREMFLQRAKLVQQHAIFIDESGQEIGRYAREMQWLATQARHWGHKSHFICQRIQQLDTTIRGQCSSLYLFTVSRKDADLLAEEWAKEELRGAHTLDQGEFFFTTRYGEIRRERAF